MTTRKIGNKTSSLSGYHSSEKALEPQYYESSLERDFLYLMDFDYRVWSVHTQPITINYQIDDRSFKYTPDVLVTYEAFSKRKTRKPLLVEIKYRKDLKANWTTLKPKFMAALRYADSQGWKFKIMTEVEIRTEYLENVKFLLPYRTIKLDITLITQVLDCLCELSEATPNKILLACTNDKQKQAELIPAIWYIVSNLFVCCDLTKKLTMESPIWVKD